MITAIFLQENLRQQIISLNLNVEVYLLLTEYIKVAICLGNKQEGEKKKALGGSFGMHRLFVLQLGGSLWKIFFFYHSCFYFLRNARES